MTYDTIGSSTTSENTGSATASITTGIAGWEATITDVDSFTGTIITKVNPTDTSTVTLNATLTSGRTALLTADSSTYVNAPTYAAATTRARVTGAVTVTSNNFVLEKFSVVISASATNGVEADGSVTIRRMVVWASDGICIDSRSNTGRTYTVTNCALITETNNSGRACLVGYSQNNTWYVYHNSLLAAVSGVYGCIYHDTGTMYLYANVMQGYGVCFGGNLGAGSGDYNVSQDATAPGSNSWKSMSGVFENTGATTWNLALKDGYNKARFSVPDYSAYTDGDTDIAGTTRVSGLRDAGCWQSPAWTTAAASDILTDLIVAYEFDSETLEDSHTNGIDLTGTGSPTYRTGKVGAKALELSGSGQDAYTPDDDLLDVTDKLTVAMWLYDDDPTGSDINWLWSKGSAYNSSICALLYHQGSGSNDISRVYINGTGYDMPHAEWTSAWKLVVWEYDGSQTGSARLRYTVNGIDQQHAAGTPASSLNSTAAGLYIGGPQGASGLPGWDGGIDAVRVWHRRLTDAEHALLWYGGAGSPYSDWASSPTTTTPIDNSNFSRRGKGRTLPTPVTIGH